MGEGLLRGGLSHSYVPRLGDPIKSGQKCPVKLSNGGRGGEIRGGRRGALGSRPGSGIGRKDPGQVLDPGAQQGDPMRGSYGVRSLFSWKWVQLHQTDTGLNNDV